MIIYALITHSNQLPLIILCEECFCRLAHKSTGVVFNSRFDSILHTLFHNKLVKYKRNVLKRSHGSNLLMKMILKEKLELRRNITGTFNQDTGF